MYSSIILQTDMAAPGTNGDAFAALDEIKPPPGVVLPPKEIKGKAHHPAMLNALTAI